MRVRPISYLLPCVAAIIFVASSAASMRASAQNDAQKSSEIADEQAERERIKSERAKLNDNLKLQREACYQKLAVTSCLNEARDGHNEKMRDLKRQEVALNDVQRKRAAADRVKSLDQRSSPEAQLQRTQERGKAMQDAAKREDSRAARQAAREAKLAEAAKNAETKEAEAKPDMKTTEGTTHAVPQGKPRQQPAAKAAPDQREGLAGEIEKNRQQAAGREKAAAERRAKAAEREAKRTKPAAAGLPLPAEAK
jgi:colicin import membrane protein